MLRTFTHSALILRSRPSGESNRELWFLSAEEGVVRATVFGGPKSRLRSHAAPFHQGKLWVYHDPVKNFRKVTDFDVQSWRPGIRESYERTMAADALAGTILASHGGGGAWERAFNMAARSLDALDGAGEEACAGVFIRFLWNWTELLGQRPDPRCCGSCARTSAGDETMWYDRLSGDFLCGDCAAGLAGQDQLLLLEPGARRWLLEAGDGTAETIPSLPDARSLAQNRALVTALMTAALGRRLSVWDW
jgi:DNA repair protein RecO (recombination protein O)